MTAIRNFHCLNCCEMHLADTMPPVSNVNDPDCSDLYESHRWQDLGAQGDIIQRCRKCLKEIHVKTIPENAACCVDGFHVWTEESVQQIRESRNSKNK